MPVSAVEFSDLVLGKILGHGISRNVYECKFDPTIVIKHEVGSGFQNVTEWKIWEEVQYTPMAKWFAPCLYISPNGLWMVQKRVSFMDHDKYPKRIPEFLNDIKYSNYGKIGKSFVCFDYGTIKTIRTRSLKLKKVDWS